jgi:hypothetical protein
LPILVAGEEQEETGSTSGVGWTSKSALNSQAHG